MLIEDLTTIDQFINEKQIQPAQGQTEGNILVLGGSPGSGKNWVIQNLTDVKNRYKIFDIDEILELVAKMEESKFKNSFRRYIENFSDDILKNELLKRLSSGGIKSFLTDENGGVYQNILREFVYEHGLSTNKRINFLLSTIDATKSNIALNGTFRAISGVIEDLKFMEEVGYSVNKNVDYLFVLNTQQEAINNANKRSKDTLRSLDNKFLIDARDNMIKNMMDLLEGKSELASTVRNIYVVFNKKDDIQYYDDNKTIKDFKYVKLKLSDKDKIENLLTLIKNEYA